jgi:hypothetical protein
MADIKISELAETTSMLGTDEFPIARTGTTRKINADNLIDYLGSTLRWRMISDAIYTALPLSTSRITMSDTSGFVVGDPVRVLQGVNLRYGIVNAISANTYIEIVGELMASGVEIDELSVGAQSQFVQIDLWAGGDYAGATSTTLLKDKSRGYFRWNNRPARRVWRNHESDSGDTDDFEDQPDANDPCWLDPGTQCARDPTCEERADGESHDDESGLER